MKPIAIEEGLMVCPQRLEELLVVDDALAKLEQHDSRVGKVVLMRFYGGMELEEIAFALNISTRTVKRDWQYGRAWLKASFRRSVADDAEQFRAT